MTLTVKKKGRSKEVPSKLVIFGPPKIGKTTFASQAPKPLFIDIEGGLDYLDSEVDSTARIDTFDELISTLKYIHQQESFEYETLVIDSMDWAEKLSTDKLVKKHNASSITDPAVKEFAYYKGVIMAAEQSMVLMKYLDAIYRKHGTKSIVIAHAEVKTIDLPNKDAFQRYELKLSKYLKARLEEWADLILFADYQFFVTSDGKTSEQKRVLRTGGDASFTGGGRMRLPDTLPISYKKLQEEINK